MKDPRPWGSYVEVRCNAPELLEKELSQKKPKQVLLGSITECFQPAELKYGITKRILEQLHRHSVRYCILTRSPLITEYIPLLKEGFCSTIYFTINLYPTAVKQLLEANGPGIDARLAAIKALAAEGIHVIPYISPLLPQLSDIKAIFQMLDDIQEIHFEGLNFSLGNIRQIIDGIRILYPAIADEYELMIHNPTVNEAIWQSTKIEIEQCAITHNVRYTLFTHTANEYFNNNYTRKSV
jgi:DNA repair photolyase